MQHTLLIAGDSFLGKHVHAYLRQRGAHVTATARASRLDYHACDVTDAARVADVVAQTKPTAVIVCAGALPSSERAVLERVHVQGSVHVLEAVARWVPTSPVLLCGSASEYGPVPDAALPIREEQPPRPLSAFGQSKLAQLHAARDTAQRLGLRVLVVRPFNLLGPGQPPHYFAAACIERLRKALRQGENGPFPVSDPLATRDFLDVRDAAAAMVGLLTAAMPPPGAVEVYNLATGIETSVLALAEHLCQLAGPFHACGSGAPGTASIPRSCGDASRLRHAIGWQPRIRWQDSVAEMWRHLGKDEG